MIAGSTKEFRLSARPLIGLLVVLGALLAVQLASDNGAGAQNGHSTLRAGNSGKCLSVYPLDFNNGAVTYQWACGGSNNVEIEDAGGGWHYIKFTHSGKCLTVNGYAWWDGATLDQWTCVGQSNQKWAGNFAENVFEVHYSQANPTKCITVHQESRADGAIVNQWQCVYQSNQAWLSRFEGPTPTPTRTTTPTVTPTGTSTTTATPTNTPVNTATPTLTPVP
jgi:hypothetical protein